MWVADLRVRHTPRHRRLAPGAQWPQARWTSAASEQRSGCARLRRVKRSRSRIVMVHEPARVVEWAIRCRRLWFSELERALEAALPGAGEALVQATAAVDEATGALHVRLPSIHPVLPPVYDVVKAEIASILWGAFGNPVMHKVTFGASALRRKPTTALSVYDPGDPAAQLWPKLIAGFRDEVLTSDDPTSAALLNDIEVSSVGLDHVWLHFTTADARRRLGQLPGAATGLNDRLDAWNGGVTAFCFAATE